MSPHLANLAIVLGATVSMGVHAQPGAAREPTLKQAMAAPAADLATSYVGMQAMIEMTRLATAGVEVVTPGGRVDRNNAESVRKQLEARHRLYADAIHQRGYSSELTGTYRVRTARPSCARTYSTLLADSTAAEPKQIEITQQGPEITLTIFQAPPTIGATVEDAVAVLDPLNSDYVIVGQLKGTTIEWRARPEVLKSWPKWANGPTADDLADCRVLMDRIQ